MVYFCANCRKEFYGVRRRKNRCVSCGGRLVRHKNDILVIKRDSKNKVGIYARGKK